MAHQLDSKSLSLSSTTENYTRPFILHSFQTVIFHISDIFGIRRDHLSFLIRSDSAGIEWVGFSDRWVNLEF